MWQCGKCKYKNSNSNKRCHGKNCEEINSKFKIIPEAKIIVEQKISKTRIDYCPQCETQRSFTQRKLGWKCGGCGKYFRIKKEKKQKKKENVIIPNE